MPEKEVGRTSVVDIAGKEVGSTVEEYDVEKNSWKILKKTLKRPRANFGFTLVPHSIFTGCTVSRPLIE